MKIGCVKEIKNNEFRVGLTPDAAKSYINAGHVVYIEKGAGVGSGFLDEEYEAAGCVMIDTATGFRQKAQTGAKPKENTPEDKQGSFGHEKTP